MPDQPQGADDDAPQDLAAAARRASERLAAVDELADNDHALTRWLAGDVFGDLDPPVDVAGWRRDAACLGMPLEVFFPEAGRGRKPDYSAALEVCATCPVTDECAAEGRHAEANLGVFGGLRPDERDHEGPAQAPTPAVPPPARPRAVDGRDATKLAPVVVPDGETYRPCTCGCGRHCGPRMGRMHSSCRSRITKRRTRARARGEPEPQSA